MADVEFNTTKNSQANFWSIKFHLCIRGNRDGI